MELANQEFAELMKNPTSKMSRLLREHIENTVNLLFEKCWTDILQHFCKNVQGQKNLYVSGKIIIFVLEK